MPGNKDWFIMVVSKGTTSSEHSNIRMLESGPEMHVLGDSCFMQFSTDRGSLKSA